VFVERFANGKWTVQKLPADGTAPAIDGLAGSSSENLWAVGTAWSGKICQSPQRAISYRHESSWKIVPTALPVTTTDAPRC
jgi:hypothetical protein